MKKLIVLSLLLLSVTQKSNAMCGFFKHKDALDKDVAAQVLIGAMAAIDQKKAANTFDHFYDYWVMQDIWGKMSAIQEDKKLKAINKKLFEQFIHEIGKIAQKRGVKITNPQLKLTRFENSEVGSCSSKPVYNHHKFIGSELHSQYQARLKKKGQALAEKFDNDEVSETIVDPAARVETTAAAVDTNAPTDSTTDSDDGDDSSEVTFSDDRSGVIVAQLRQATQLDQQAQPTIIEQLLQNKFALSCGVGAVVLLVYKYKNHIKEWIAHLREDKAESQETAQAQEKQSIEQIEETLNHLKQLIAKGK